MPKHQINNSAYRAEKPDHSLRNCLGHFATGVTIVTYESEDGERGLTINSFTSVSLDPPLVLVCLDKRSNAIEFIPDTNFAINVLHTDQRDLARHFAGRKSPELCPQWERVNDVPLLSQSLAWFRCEPWTLLDAGDHMIVVGKVTDFGTSDHDPLCFFRGEFLQLEAAPSTTKLQP